MNRYYRYIKSGINLLRSFWKDSTFLVNQEYKRTRITAWIDLVVCFVCYGADFSNYVSFHFYDLNRKGRRRFITFYRNEKLWHIFSKSAHEKFLDKASFNEAFKPFILRDWLDTRKNSQDKVLGFIKSQGNVIVKPVDSCMGKGIHKVAADDSEQMESFITELNNGHHYIVEEILENVPEVKKFNPPSLNTVRIVTCLDKEKHIHILASCLRTGVSDAITDNVCTGGIVCHIDEQYGIIDTKAKNHIGASYSVHPNSGVYMVGCQIPQWDAVIKLAKEAALQIPSARYVGWDIAITTKGLDLLEGNIPPDEGVTQMCTMEGMYDRIMSLL